MSAAKHHADLILCRKQPGISVGRLCEKCDGKCPVCDSTTAPTTQVHICDECNYAGQRGTSGNGRCVICNGLGVADAYYCRQCSIMEKDVSDTGGEMISFLMFLARWMPKDC